MSEINNVITEIVCMLNNKDKILVILKGVLSKDEYTNAETNFKSLESSIREYTHALAVYTPIPSKKVDPYVAGGIADAIAGPGAGVYAATSAANRNAEIDNARIKTMEAKIHKESEETKLIRIYNTVKEIVYAIPAAKQIHLTAYTEAIRKEEQEKKQKVVEEKRTQLGVWISIVFMIAIMAILALIGIEINFFITLIVVVLSIIIGIAISNKRIK